MGGWYDLDGFVPGHSLGQYISGLARFGASTGDPACHRRFTLSSRVSPRPWARTINPSCAQRQTCGSVTPSTSTSSASSIAATLSNVPESKDLLNRVLAGCQPLLPAKGHDRIGKKDPPYDETYVMPENLFTACELTGNPAFTEPRASKYMLDREYFDRLANGEDPFPGQHAYSHAIALSSAGKA